MKLAGKCNRHSLGWSEYVRSERLKRNLNTCLSELCDTAYNKCKLGGNPCYQVNMFLFFIILYFLITIKTDKVHELSKPITQCTFETHSKMFLFC